MSDYDNQAVQDLIRGIRKRMSICNCGTAKFYPLLQKMLERADHLDKPDSEFVSFYAPLEDIPASAVEFIAKVMDSWGLLEHGGGIGGAWLSYEGEMFLEFLRVFGMDDTAWPEWVWEE